MKLKTIKAQADGRDQEVALVRDGMPLYEDDKGAEIAFDAPHAVATIKRVSQERDDSRARAEHAEAAAKPFAGMDPDKALEALKLATNIDAGKLKDANEVQRIKDEVATAYEQKIVDLQAEHDKEKQRLTSDLHETMLASAFGNSKYVAEKMGQPLPLVRSYFGPRFDVQDGKVVTLIDGKPLMSKQKPGEYADFDEAIAHHVAADPYTDNWLKSNGASGSGAQSGTLPSSQNGGANFQSLPPVERMKQARREASA